MPGSFGFRLACYQEFGWTPADVLRALHDHPQECRLLAVNFEETALYHAEQRRDMDSGRGGGGGGGGGGFVAESVIGGDDEVDWHEAELDEEG